MVSEAREYYIETEQEPPPDADPLIGFNMVRLRRGKGVLGNVAKDLGLHTLGVGVEAFKKNVTPDAVADITKAGASKLFNIIKDKIAKSGMKGKGFYKGKRLQKGKNFQGKRIQKGKSMWTPPKSDPLKHIKNSPFFKKIMSDYKNKKAILTNV